MASDQSPAVVALEQEQARQRLERPESDLDSGLKNTFPASDPVSSTITAIPTGTADTASLAAAIDVIGNETPFVDEILSKESSDEGAQPASLASEELTALRLEIQKLREGMMEIGEGTLRVAQAQAGELIDATRDQVRTRPFAAVGIAALIGYVWGATR